MVAGRSSQLHSMCPFGVSGESCVSSCGKPVRVHECAGHLPVLEGDAIIIGSIASACLHCSCTISAEWLCLFLQFIFAGGKIFVTGRGGNCRLQAGLPLMKFIRAGWPEVAMYLQLSCTFHPGVVRRYYVGDQTGHLLTTPAFIIADQQFPCILAQQSMPLIPWLLTCHVHVHKGQPCSIYCATLNTRRTPFRPFSLRQRRSDIDLQAIFSRRIIF